MVLATGLFLGVILFCGSWFILPFMLRKKAEKEIRRFCRDQGILVLTFDDGPCPVTTPMVMDCLKANNLPASFFVLADNVDRESTIVKALVQEGHEIGNHTRFHRNAWKTIPGLDIADIRAGLQSVNKQGANGLLFRPPYGKVTLGGWLYMLFSGMTPCWWTIDPRDSLEDPLPKDQVLENVERQNGGVVLLHDNDRYPDPDHQEYVRDIIQGCAGIAREKGLTVMTYSAMISRMQGIAS